MKVKELLGKAKKELKTDKEVSIVDKIKNSLSAIESAKKDS